MVTLLRCLLLCTAIAGCAKGTRALGEACENTNQCLPGTFCLKTVCAATQCLADVDCAPGASCTGDGHCVGGGAGGPTIDNVSGLGAGGRVGVDNAILITGTNLNAASVAIFDASFKQLADVVVSDSDASSIHAVLPVSTIGATASGLLLRVATALGSATRDLGTLQGEPGPPGPPGPTGQTLALPANCIDGDVLLFVGGQLACAPYQRGILRLSALNFIPVANSGHYFGVGYSYMGGSYDMRRDTGDTAGPVDAPLTLPQGAVIDRVRCWLKGTATTNVAMRAGLYSLRLSGATYNWVSCNVGADPSTTCTGDCVVDIPLIPAGDPNYAVCRVSDPSFSTTSQTTNQLFVEVSTASGTALTTALRHCVIEYSIPTR
jgi:hypothetical protein